MRSPKVVLENLAKHSNDANYQYDRLYRNLFNEEFFLLAYGNIYAKTGNMTAGTDKQTIDDMSLERIRKIMGRLRDCSYQPKPARRKYIPKKNGKMRPLGIPSFEDKLVQEVLRMILESIYEGTFQACSHGFRPNKSCHTALRSIKTLFTGAKWFVEGDIKGFFDNIHHATLTQILRKRIADERFINLIEKFLKAGYLEDWVYHKTYSGTPQGGIISPILSNIYLNELDKYMNIYKRKFDIGRVRKRNTKYRTLSKRLCNARKKLATDWDNISEDERSISKQNIRQLENAMLQEQPTQPQDDSYRRLQYVRYADDFIIGVIGSKADANKIKQDLTSFLEENLMLELSQEKTLITNSRDKARFLGYDIRVKRDQSITRLSDGTVQRSHNLIPELYMPQDLWIKRIFEEKIAIIHRETGKWKPVHRPELIYNDDLEILQTYNSKIRGLYNYYRMALNVCNLADYSYFMEYSMYKTFAKKYKSSVSKIITKYSVNGNFVVKYKIKRGEKSIPFYNEGFKRNMEVSANVSDSTPNVGMYNSRTSTVQRLCAERCEWCGSENVVIHMHHVRKLKDLKGKARWERQMIARSRKTMALCKSCHIALHNGKLD